MDRAVLSFVSSAGKREENIRAAMQAVERLPGTTVIAKSGLYEFLLKGTSPQEQDSVSSCAVILTGMSPTALYGACKGIAAALGRNPDSPGISPIDINLLIYEGKAGRNDELSLPHEELLKLPSILNPLSQIFKDGKALDYKFHNS